MKTNEEYRLLEQQNLELLVVIEANNVMLEKIACLGNGDRHGNSVGNHGSPEYVVESYE